MIGIGFEICLIVVFGSGLRPTPELAVDDSDCQRSRKLNPGGVESTKGPEKNAMSEESLEESQSNSAHG